MEVMYDRYTKAICSAADKAIHISSEIPYLPKKVRNIRAQAKAEHWKMRTVGKSDSMAWNEAKNKRNRYRNEATRLKRKYEHQSKEVRKVEAVMHSATSAMQKMSTLRKIAGRRRAPPEHMDDRAINRFQKYWANMYDGPPLERT
jgi:hypothetical protein